MLKIHAAKFSEEPSFVPVPEAQQHAFVCSQFEEPSFHFYWHYHREIELAFVRRGSGLRYIGRSVEPCGPGDLVLVGSNLPHTWGSLSRHPSVARWSVIWLSPDRWGKEFWGMPEVKSLRKLLADAACGIQFTGNEVKKIGDLMESMAHLPPPSFGSLGALFKIFQLLLSANRRLLNSNPTSLGGLRGDRRLQHVLSLIDQSSDEKLSQSQVSREIKMAPAVFSRWFKLHMGRTFQHYVNEVRIARVCARLADTNESITTIAFASGFQNLANFNRRFLEITRFTPKEFRNKTRLLLDNRPSSMTVRNGPNDVIEIDNPLKGREPGPGSPPKGGKSS
ncbi:MAG TPA: AraC family transcriptional regulator [Verrucomicrobiae bacterium]|jgi:AraC-like DNA-binding protein